MRRLWLLMVVLSAAISAFGQACVPGPNITCTPNLDLWLPGQHYQNWNTPLNDNFTLIDSLVFPISGGTITGPLIDSANGAASTPAVSLTGAPFAGGTGTTTVPLFYVNHGTSPTSWSTAGTLIGGNAPTGFTGNLEDFHLNGGPPLFSVNASGNVNAAGAINATGAVSGASISTAGAVTAATATISGLATVGGLTLSGTALINNIVFVPPGTGTLSAAIAANPGPNMEYFLGCGTYVDNVVISTGFNWIRGGGIGCTNMEPASSGSALIAITPPTASAPMYYNSVTDLTMFNASAFAVDGLQLNNLPSASPHNDYNHFANLYISGFQNNINITGGNLTNSFDIITITNAIANNFNIVSTQPVNSLSTRVLRSFAAGGYGLYANVDSATTWEFNSPDFEQNGQSILTSNCAGLYITTTSEVQGVTIDGAGYWEANCIGGDANATDIRITGLQNTGWVITGQRFSFGAGGNYGCAIFADATEGSAFINGNTAFKPGSTCDADYKITNSDTTTGFSGYVVGPNIYVNGGMQETLFTGTGPITYQKVVAGGPMQFTRGLEAGFPTATYSKLPPCTTTITGTLFTIVDANTNTWGGAITSGGGGATVLAFCDGSGWFVAAK